MLATMSELHTERLILRRWKASDREPFALLNANPDVMRHMPGPLDRAQSDAMLARMEAHFDEHGFGLWAVQVRETGRLAGFVGLSRPRFEAYFTPCVEVGWRLDRDHWGHGYATEAARASLEFGFEVMDLPEIVSFTVPGNQRSRRVMQRLGMRHGAGDEFDHPGLPQGHPLRRHVLYRLSQADWRRGPAPA